MYLLECLHIFEKISGVIAGTEKPAEPLAEPSFVEYLNLARDGKASPEMQKYLGDVFERGLAAGEAIQKSGLLHNIFNKELPCCTDSLTILHIPCTVCDHDEL
jgi:hypothetical protein